MCKFKLQCKFLPNVLICEIFEFAFLSSQFHLPSITTSMSSGHGWSWLSTTSSHLWPLAVFLPLLSLSLFIPPSSSGRWLSDFPYLSCLQYALWGLSFPYYVCKAFQLSFTDFEYKCSYCCHLRHPRPKLKYKSLVKLKLVSFSLWEFNVSAVLLIRLWRPLVAVSQISLYILLTNYHEWWSGSCNKMQEK